MASNWEVATKVEGIKELFSSCNATDKDYKEQLIVKMPEIKEAMEALEKMVKS